MKFFVYALITIFCATDAVCCCANESSYIPSFSETPKNINITVDFLYWTVKEEGIGNDNWAQISYAANPTTIVLNVQALSFNYSPGFRIGFGYRLPYHWDTKLSYTWFRTSAKDEIATDGQITSPFFGNFYASNYKYNQASMNFSVLFNMFDWDFGRKYWISNGISLRPFGGIKSGWIDQTIHTKWSSATLFAKENLKNNFCGIGPRGGFQSQWKIGPETGFFSLMGDFATALMWANWSIPDIYTNSKPEQVEVRYEERYSASIMFQSFLGIGWEMNCNKNSYLSIRAGFEAQIWLEQFQINDWNVGKLNNQLTLMGGTFGFNFIF